MSAKHVPKVASRSTRTIGRVLAWSAVTFLLVIQWQSVRSGIWVDSDVYVLGGRTILEAGDLYAVATKVDLPFTYAPFAAVVFVPLALLPVALGRAILSILSICCYVGILYLVGRRLSLPPEKIALFGLLGLALEPMLRNLLLGQINLILMALVVVDCLVVRQRWRGLLVGVAAGVKIVPGVFVLYFLIRRDWSAVGRAVLGLLATVTIGWLVTPIATKDYWGGGFLGLGRFGSTAVAGADNQSLLGVWLRSAGQSTPPSVVVVICTVLGLVIGLVCARACLRQSSVDAEVRAIACVALAGLLGSPVSWSHHWVWIMLALLVLASQAAWAWLGLMAPILVVGPFWALYEENGFRPPASVGEALLGAAYVILAPAVLTLVVRKRYSGAGCATDQTISSGSRRESLVEARDNEKLIHEPPLPDNQEGTEH